MNPKASKGNNGRCSQASSGLLVPQRSRRQRSTSSLHNKALMPTRLCCRLPHSQMGLGPFREQLHPPTPWASEGTPGGWLQGVPTHVAGAARERREPQAGRMGSWEGDLGCWGGGKSMPQGPTSSEELILLPVSPGTMGFIRWMRLA